MRVRMSETRPELDGSHISRSTRRRGCQPRCPWRLPTLASRKHLQAQLGRALTCRTFMRAAFVRTVGVAVLLASGTAMADGFAWTAPAGCPTTADVRERIDRRLVD